MVGGLLISDVTLDDYGVGVAFLVEGEGGVADAIFDIGSGHGEAHNAVLDRHLIESVVGLVDYHDGLGWHLLVLGVGEGDFVSAVFLFHLGFAVLVVKVEVEVVITFLAFLGGEVSEDERVFILFGEGLLENPVLLAVGACLCLYIATENLHAHLGQGLLSFGVYLDGAVEGDYSLYIETHIHLYAFGVVHLVRTFFENRFDLGGNLRIEGDTKEEEKDERELSFHKVDFYLLFFFGIFISLRP